MTKVILYIRVSTDEQAENGYSLGDQEDQLVRYCENKGWSVLKIFREDHSAKTLHRPALSEMRAFARKHQHEVTKVVFVKWDRFARNIRDSYALIDEFRGLHIETCAIEQPLDFDVPESKIMLAIYIATPEVENDRRSMNVTRGMRKAKLSGRWLGPAPRGYRNTRDDNNRPIIIPNHDAEYVKQSFELVLTYGGNVERARRHLYIRGFECSSSNFSRMVRNIVYIGKIRVPAYKDQPEEIVDGLHQPLVDTETFRLVHDILNSNKVENTKRYKIHDRFPLRGYMKCHQCGLPLTASHSKGKMGQQYGYYHCRSGCSVRHRAEDVNNDFGKLIRGISSNRGVIELYATILMEVFKDSDRDFKLQREMIQNEIKKNKARLNHAMDEMLDRRITSEEYREIKQRYDALIKRLEANKTELEGGEDFGKYIKGCAKYLKDLDKLYNDVSTDMKQTLIRSLFAEKLVYEKTGFRTPVLTDGARFMTLETNELEEIKKGIINEEIDYSRSVVRTGIEPVLPE